MTKENTPLNIKEGQDLSYWFDEMVDNIRIDQAILESGTARDEMKKVYSSIFLNDTGAMAKNARELATKFLIQEVLKIYITELIESRALPNELALELSDSKILVWAKIDDDDEKTENALLMVEARTNAQFINSGFHISSLIVEQSDNLPIPAHYKTVKFQTKAA